MGTPVGRADTPERVAFEPSRNERGSQGTTSDAAMSAFALRALEGRGSNLSRSRRVKQGAAKWGKVDLTGNL